MFFEVVDAHSRLRDNEFYYSREDHLNARDVICQVWSAGPVSKQQLATFKIRRVLAFPKEKWYQTNHFIALSSCHKRFTRTLCGEFQKWNEE